MSDPLLGEVKVKMALKDEKVNSRRYKEVVQGEEKLMGDVYVPRATLALIGNPDKLEIIIRPINE